MKAKRKLARWYGVNRAQLHAELDTYYARLYGSSVRKCATSLLLKKSTAKIPLRNLPCVLKKKAIKQFGTCWTRRVVLEAWDKLGQKEGGMLKGKRL